MASDDVAKALALAARFKRERDEARRKLAEVDEWVTIDEGARIAGYDGPGPLYSKRSRGTLRCQKRGKILYVRKSDCMLIANTNTTRQRASA